MRAAGVPDETLLDFMRTLCKTFGVDARSPKRTSYGALELDLFCPSSSDFELLVEAVKPVAHIEFTRDLNIAAPHTSDAEALSEARSLFNGERYWECHEVLEGVWRTKEGVEKSLLQGMILVCAAFVHLQKGEKGIALGVLERASKQLDYPSKEYGGIEVGRLREEVASILQTRSFSNFRL